MRRLSLLQSYCSRRSRPAAARSEATGADRFMPGAGGPSPDRLLKELVSRARWSRRSEPRKSVVFPPLITGAHLDKTKPGSASSETSRASSTMDRRAGPRRIRVRRGGENESAAVLDLFDFGVPVDVEAPPANEIVSEEFDKMMEKECASAGKDLEDAKPLCLVFGASITESHGSDSVPISPTETVPTTEET